MDILNELSQISKIQQQNNQKFNKESNKNKYNNNSLSSLIFLESPASCYYFYVNYTNNEPYYFEPIFSKFFVLNNIVTSYLNNYKILLVPYYLFIGNMYIKAYVTFMSKFFEFSEIANYRYNKIQKINLSIKDLIDEDSLHEFFENQKPKTNKLPYVKNHFCKVDICPYFHICKFKNNV